MCSSNKRFSLLLLEPGEIFYEDHTAECYIFADEKITQAAVKKCDSSITKANNHDSKDSLHESTPDNSKLHTDVPEAVSGQTIQGHDEGAIPIILPKSDLEFHQKLQNVESKTFHATSKSWRMEEIGMPFSGKLKLCSKSLVFEPNSIKFPVIRIPFRACIKLSSSDDLKIFTVKIFCTLSVEMLKDNRLEPYTFLRPANGYCQHYIFSVSPSGACNIESPKKSSVLPHLNQLHRAASLPPNEQNTMTCAISRSVHARRSFDVNEFDGAPIGPVLMNESAYRITPLLQESGIVALTYDHIYFQPYSDKQEFISVPVKNILQIIKRRYLLQPVAMELFFTKSSKLPHLFLSFKTEVVRNALSELLESIQSKESSSKDSNSTSNHIDRILYQWSVGAISNYDYLMELNSAGGRSCNDLTQYPVFPWVVQDYSSPYLDLNNVTVFRDLSKPIGALNKFRLKKLKARLKELGSDSLGGEFLYGSHYSSPGFILFFLVRAQPHLALCLHNGRFDHPDRMFNSIGDTYHNVTRNPSDFKELIPEFYDVSTKGQFLVKPPGVNLGVRQSGETVADVHLPPWAKSPQDLVEKFRAALESDYVSKNLHHWIDLIFGYKQRGEQARLCDNLFHPMCYEGSVDLSSIDDLSEREALEVQIAEFGQVPEQVFFHPHPQRNLSLGLYDSLYLTPMKKVADLTQVDSQTDCDNGNKLPILNCDNPDLITKYICQHSTYDICPVCAFCKLCFASICDSYMNETRSSFYCPTSKRKSQLVAHCCQSYACNNCTLLSYQILSHAGKLNIKTSRRGSYKKDIHLDSSLNDNKGNIDISIPKEKLVKSRNKRSSMIEIPKSSKSDLMSLATSFDDSSSYSPSKLPNSGSKIHEIFSMIKSDFSSSLRLTKREMNRSSNFRKDCDCSLTIGEGHGTYAAVVSGMSSLIRKDKETEDISVNVVRALKCVATNDCFSSPVVQLLLLPPSHLAVVTASPVVKILDIPSLKQISSHRAGDLNCSAALYFPSLSTLLISSYDGYLYSYSQNHENRGSLNTSPAKRTLRRESSQFKGTFDATGKIRKEIRVSQSSLVSMVWHNNHLYIGSLDNKVHVYHFPWRPSFNGLSTQSTFKRNCSYDLDADELLLLNRGVVHDFMCSDGPSDRDGTKYQQCSCHTVNGKTDLLANNPNRNTIGRDTFEFKNLSNHMDLRYSLNHNSPVSTVCVLPSTDESEGNNEFVVVGQRDGEISVWSGNQTKILVSMRCHDSPIVSLCYWSSLDPYITYFSDNIKTQDQMYTPTKEYELSSGNFGIDKTCDDVDPNEDWVLVNENIPQDFRVSRNSSSSKSLFSKSNSKLQYILSASKSGEIKLLSFDSCDDSRLRILSDWHAGEPIESMVWDGRFVVVGGCSGDLIVKDFASSSTFRLPAHEGAVTSLCFSECGRVLVTGGMDGTVKLWGFQFPDFLSSNETSGADM